MFFVKKEDIQYTAPLDLLDNIDIFTNDKLDTEVLFTVGKQEVIKEKDKYFIANVFDNSQRKEITRNSAYELLNIEKQNLNSDNEIKMYID